MDKTSGLILDYYDDQEATRDGKSAIGLAANVPELFAKTAQVLSAEQRDQLPCDVFALTLIDGDSQLKKFAMNDAGNTRMSVEYFLQRGHILPLQAQKTAATNLLTGCAWYDVQLPDTHRDLLEKVAAGHFITKNAFGVAGLLTAAAMGPGALRETQANLKTVKPAGGTIMTPDQLKAQRASQQGV